MVDHNFSIQTRQKSEVLVQTGETLDPLATFESDVRKVDGYSAVSIFVTGTGSIRVRVEEACTEDGTFGLSGTLASVLDPDSGLYIICERFGTCGAFAKFYVDNLDPVADAVIDACISGVPVGGGTSSGAGAFLDTRAATFVVGPDHADYPMTEAGLNAAIAALPAAGGEIYIREGTIAITAPIILPDKHVSIRGAGLATVLSYTYGGALFYDNFDKAVRFESFAILGNNTAGQVDFDFGAGPRGSYTFYWTNIQSNSTRKLVRTVAPGVVYGGFKNVTWTPIAGASTFWWDGPGYADFVSCGFGLPGAGGTVNTSGFGAYFANCTVYIANGASFSFNTAVNSDFLGGGTFTTAYGLFANCTFQGGAILVPTGTVTVSGCGFYSVVARQIDASVAGIVLCSSSEFSGWTTEAIRLAGSNSVITGNKNCKVTETGTGQANVYSNNTGFDGSTLGTSSISLVDDGQTKQTTTTPYAVVTTDRTLLIDATAGNKVVNLQTAAAAKWRKISIKKADASVNTVTIDGDGGETIDGATTKVLGVQYESVTLQSDGSNWHIL